MTLPPYNNARGDAELVGVPPFTFQSVVMRQFPLRARVDRMQAFLDDFINIMPREMGYFRASMPFVTFVMLNYGRMASDVVKGGWVSQNEFGFSIPLSCYREIDGELVYQGSASILPFIFVDDESSQITGREVYGWPKTQGWLAREIDPWTRYPLASRELLALSTSVFDKAYVGEDERTRTVVEVIEEPEPTFSQVPPRFASPVYPWISWPQAFVNALDLWSNAIDWAMSLPSRGFPSEGPEQWKALFEQLDRLNPTKRSSWDLLNLKQFRDAELPDCVSYQAIVNSTMSLLSFNDGGLLGGPRIIQGDPTGGFRIRIHRYETTPIIELLGLEVDHEHRGPDATVATLKPVFPWWMDIDAEYGVGRVVACRTRDSSWWVPAGEGLGGGGGEDAADEPSAKPRSQHGPNPFNRARGAAQITYPGPFCFPEAVLHVLPLLADEDQLRTFCDAYLNSDLVEHHFEPLGCFVYLIVTSYEKMYSSTDNIGQWAHRGCRFSIPVKCYSVERDDRGNVIQTSKKLLSVGLVSPFLYLDGQRSTQTMREVLGWPAEQASVVGPPNPWLEQSDRTTLLRVSTQVLDAFGVGDEDRWQDLIEVVSGNLLGEDDVHRWWDVAREWGSELTDLVHRHSSVARHAAEQVVDLKALALDLLVRKMPFNEFSFKQFRDSAEPLHACYQAIVRSRTVLERLWDLREIEESLHVVIHDRASARIVETLGLKVKTTLTADGGTRAVLEPQRPFWLKADVRTELGHNLCWRSKDRKWHEETWSHDAFFVDGHEMEIGRGAVEELERDPIAEAGVWHDRRRRQDVARWVDEWVSECDPDSRDANKRPLTLEEALVAVEEVDPKIALDSVLSNEWNHWGSPRWYRRRVLREDVEQKPAICVRRDSVGLAADDVFPVPDGCSAYQGGERDVLGWWTVEQPDQRRGAETTRTKGHRRSRGGGRGEGHDASPAHETDRGGA